jgi:predicted nucleic acid-binding protein
LIDTGAIVALVDDKDKWHKATIDAFEAMLRFPLATTAAVLGEVFHLLRGRREQEAAWTIIQSGAVTVMPIGDDDLADVHVLMQRYADRPMDFADATLVHLATRESLATILTIDHNDFETYRFGRGRRFRIVPSRRPSA